jgi:hypothetical protein
MYNPSYCRDEDKSIMHLKPVQEKIAISYLKKENKNKRAGGVAQVIECSSSKQEALGSIPGAEQKNKTTSKKITTKSKYHP